MSTLAKPEQELSEWVSEQLRYNNVPRLVDVKTFVLQQGLPLGKKEIAKVLRLHPQYHMNMPQQRMAGRAKMYRPVIVNELGHWHADIGFFAINKDYETPISYRAGYLIAKDVLSRMIYATPLIKNRQADSIISAFNKLFEMHKKVHPDVLVKSISFDRETSVMSKKVQAFFNEKGIAFRAFQMSASKAKFAEGAIRQIRQVVKRLLLRKREKDRWWNLLPVATNVLNNQEIVVDGKKLGYTPMQVTKETVTAFKKKLFKAAPAYYAAQFDLSPDLVSFKFEEGNLVRAKLIATSSAVLGKRSEINLTEDVFVIEKKVPYVTRNMKVGKGYKCRNTVTNEVEVFQEDEIVLASTDQV